MKKLPSGLLPPSKTFTRKSSLRKTDLVGPAVGLLQPINQGAKEETVTGNSECSFGIVLSRVEKLCDLLTHFIGIEKTT